MYSDTPLIGLLRNVRAKGHPAFERHCCFIYTNILARIITGKGFFLHVFHKVFQFAFSDGRHWTSMKHPMNLEKHASAKNVREEWHEIQPLS